VHPSVFDICFGTNSAKFYRFWFKWYTQI